MALAFTKVEGLGNDFLLLDRRGLDRSALEREVERLQQVAPALCQRRTGVGGDGLLILGAPLHASSDATMLVVNHDGSRPEMCGNGVRCVALIVAHDMGRDTVVIDTDAGAKRCVVVTRGADGKHGDVRVDMGPALDLGERAPAAGDGLTFRAVSMGNPHAVAFVEREPEPLARSLGPAVEIAAEFPERTNVEVARRHDDGTVELWVWERGCGITQACGTGACATAVAAVLADLAQRGTPIAVRLPGGTLRIVVPEDKGAGIEMTGAAAVVFTGQIAAP